MLQRFQEFIQQQHLFPVGEEVLLAVSGGRDSVAMLDLCRRAGIPFAVAHCNFHLRPGDCDRDQQFVRRLAESAGAVFHTVDFDTRAVADSRGMSIEEAARHLRYSWFSDLCRRHGFPCVATAHHRDDSVETFFLNLFRGTGIAGLQGIRPSASFLGTTLVRPLLCFSRADIDRYVAEQHLEYVDDSTNLELDARRNRIRLQLMPLLRELYPSVDATMAANIERLHDAGLLYRECLDQLRSRLLQPYPSRVPDLPFSILSVDLREVDSLAAPATVLFELLRPYGFNGATVADILRTGSAATGRLFFSSTHTAELHRGLLLLAPTVQPAAASAPDVRPWRPGDRFRPKGMKGSRLVSDFLKDLHLSRIEKAFVKVKLSPDGRILAVVGLRDADQNP
ncbi:MAG: tRNA lysidine(34) synthetase TilS [Bacteroidales bacterium]|nr:tRNA lysidine(34) synthetase TilS [Bacteroidales bacterium]